MGRPKVYLNCATSHDGFLAASDGSPVRFSDDVDLQRVHRLRAECDAILVGVGTILSDDPHLTVKPEHHGGRVEQPLRVVLDAFGRTPLDARVMDDAAPTIIFTGPDAPPISGGRQMRIDAKGGRLDLHSALDDLVALRIRSVMVEGGEQVLHAFMATDLWDRFTVYQAPDDLGGTGPRLWKGDGPGSMGLGLVSEEPQGAGTLWTFSPR